MTLDFLPVIEDWSQRLHETKSLSGKSLLNALRRLSQAALNFTQLGKLDRALLRAMEDEQAAASLPQLRLAILGSATTLHLPPGIRVAALRRGLLVTIYEGDYGLYLPELMNQTSALHAFKPDALLLALDAHHLAGAAGATASSALSLMEQCWALAAQNLRCPVIQQTVLPVFPPLLGNNEQRLAASPAAIVTAINAALPARAEAAGVHLLALDQFFQPAGLAAWYEPSLWYKSKHEVHPRAAIVYGDQVARELAALRGLSSKCLVLDLDNTLWGGVIGDDGLAGIALGQGNALGEAFVAFQHFCLSLTRRGVILAVCSKNDESNARLPFQQHPEMVLRETDIACFVANWQDKASNLRDIASRLNIGIDSLVFADDNPAERALIRQELPAVQVPELTDDPATYIDLIARAGYFEGLRITVEDEERSRQYQANAERNRMREEVTDMAGYLTSLAMHCTIRPFDSANAPRITQLINKTNQFNLTTRRYTDAEIRAPRWPTRAIITMQVRLTDRFGDNGTIAILIVAPVRPAEATIDTWLMSCRVLGRRVEEACLNALVAACQDHGIDRLIGVYKPTEKNSMVRDLYPRLGFSPAESPGDSPDVARRFVLNLGIYQPAVVPMHLEDTLSASNLEPAHR